MSTIVVLVALPLLVLASALVFDVGRLYVAARDARNAADAGALAKATDCARGVSSTSFTPYETNSTRLSNTPGCVSGATTVSMEKTIDPNFIPGGTRTVTRTSTARWSTLGSATTAPIVISSCEYSTALLDGATDVYFLLDNAPPSGRCASLPGGFSLLDGSSGNRCATNVTSGVGTVGATGQPGNALQQIIPCITNPGGTLPRDVLVAIYDSAQCLAQGCQGNDIYPIVGFAMIRLTGYNFNGNNLYPADMPSSCPGAPRRGTTSCIRGDFIRFVTSQGTPGNSGDFGVFQVSLTP